MTNEAAKSVENKNGAIRGGDETILVVDDENEIVTFLTQVLQKYGYRVCSANSTEQAIEKYAEELDDIHLLISDVIMTGKDGSALVEHLLHVKPNMRYFFISGYMDITDVKNKELIQNADLLQKPFDKYSLLKLVRNYLDQK